LTGSTEACKLFQAGHTKASLVAYFIGNIYAKNIKIHSCASKL